MFRSHDPPPLRRPLPLARAGSVASQGRGPEVMFQRSGSMFCFGLMLSSHAPPPATPTPPAIAGGSVASQGRGPEVLFQRSGSMFCFWSYAQFSRPSPGYADPSRYRGRGVIFPETHSEQTNTDYCSSVRGHGRGCRRARCDGFRSSSETDACSG